MVILVGHEQAKMKLSNLSKVAQLMKQSGSRAPVLTISTSQRPSNPICDKTHSKFKIMFGKCNYFKGVGKI
jgi:hypothetical protein